MLNETDTREGKAPSAPGFKAPSAPGFSAPSAPGFNALSSPLSIVESVAPNGSGGASPSRLCTLHLCTPHKCIGEIEELTLADQIWTSHGV
jgi:hypothetical protein